MTLLNTGTSEVQFPEEAVIGFLHFAKASKPVLGAIQPPIQWVPGTFTLGVKRLGHEADKSSPSSSEVNNAWSYTSTPQYIFITWRLVRHRDNFTFNFV
jgi:hypothetical protein